jgi:hypothetical protein
MIYTEVDDAARAPLKRKIFVPNVSVYLKDRASGKQTEPVVTNARGWFLTPVLAPGKYSICWNASGFESGCTTDQDVSIQHTVVTPAPVAIRASGKTIFGRVTFSNGAPCSFSAPVFGLEGNAKVTLLGSAGTVLGQPIPTNVAGEFIVTDLPVGATGLGAECDGMKSDTTGIENAKAGPVQVRIRNTAPRIGEVFAGSSARRLRRAAPGGTIPISVAVHDAEQRSLHYYWHPSDAGAPFVSRDAPTVRWTLPKSAGTHTMYVLVEDKAGGHSIGRVDVVTGSTAVIFSATVTETTGAPIPGAEVTVNGQPTLTNAQGYFFLQLPAESSRYLLNIHKDGYALFSRILFTELVGGKFSLVKARSFTLRPGDRLSVTDPSTRNSPGAQIEAAANAFVDGSGRAPAGPLTVHIATLDLRDPVGRMPGNFGGVAANGAKVRLASYGGVDVEIRDGAGNRYNLASGKTATVRIPVDPAAQAAKTPVSVPLWDYDPQQGLWKQQGTAKRNGQFYEATVQHFSAINAAAAASNAACMRLHYDPGTVNFPFNLHITIPLITGADTTVIAPVASSATDVIAELPPNEPITLQIDTVELSKQTVNSGAGAAGPADPNPPPGTCTSDAYMTVAPTDALGFDANNLLFSPGGFLNYFGLDDQVSADAYYAAIDPTTIGGAGTISSLGTTVTGAGTNFTTFFVSGYILRQHCSELAGRSHWSTFQSWPTARASPRVPGRHSIR